jgi:hypothetical protein
MKDNFSTRSEQYAQFRPTYPGELFDYLLSIVPFTDSAWDCGTGNGQVARQLAHSFSTVHATDISRQQIDKAEARPNIEYSIQPAERTSFPDNSFDLITVAQAIHWFDFDAFYKEVRRTAKDQAILAIIGYNLVQITPAIDEVIAHFYKNIVGPYWDKERKYVDEGYQTIPFPFEEIKAPSFKNEFEWTPDHLIGYIGTWSAVKHYEKKNGQDPVDLVREPLLQAWGDDATKPVDFPILLRVARIIKS